MGEISEEQFDEIINKIFDNVNSMKGDIDFELIKFGIMELIIESTTGYEKFKKILKIIDDSKREAYLLYKQGYLVDDKMIKYIHHLRAEKYMKEFGQYDFQNENSRSKVLTKKRDIK